MFLELAFIKHSESQKIRKRNNVKVLQSKKTKEHKWNSQNLPEEEEPRSLK